MSEQHRGPGRRQVLRGAGAGAVAMGAVAAPGIVGAAEASAAAAPAATVVSCRTGRYDVLALLDAHGPFPMPRQEAFPDASAADWRRARRIDPAAFGPRGEWRLDFRCFAVRRPGGRFVLVDSGVGPAGSPASSWAPVPGHLPERLAAAGIEPEDVDAVVLTHLHEDHFGWSVGLDGVPTFPRARYVLQRTEIAALAEDDAAMTYIVEPLRRTGQLHVVDGEVRMAGRGRAAVNSIGLVPTPGHTPGHQSVIVDGGRRRIVITGDVLVHAVQLANPEVAYALEGDQEAARRTRRELLERAADERALLATAHLNRPFVRPPHHC